MKKFWKSFLVIALGLVVAIPVYASSNNAKVKGQQETEQQKQKEQEDVFREIDVTLDGDSKEVEEGDPIVFTALAEKKGQFDEEDGSIHELVITKGGGEVDRITLDALTKQDVNGDGLYETNYELDTTDMEPGTYFATYEIILNSGESHVYWQGISNSVQFVVLPVVDEEETEDGGPWIHVHVKGNHLGKDITLYYNNGEQLPMNLTNKSNKNAKYTAKKPEGFVGDDVSISIGGTTLQKSNTNGNGTFNFWFDVANDEVDANGANKKVEKVKEAKDKPDRNGSEKAESKRNEKSRK